MEIDVDLGEGNLERPDADLERPNADANLEQPDIALEQPDIALEQQALALEQPDITLKSDTNILCDFDIESDISRELIKKPWLRFKGVTFSKKYNL